MVLIGQVNPQLVTAINLHGNYAVGVSGEDAGLIRAVARDPDLGFVGDVARNNPGILQGLIADEFIPVIATIGTDESGQAYNINADVVAGAIAEALGAEKLVYLTDIEGLRRDVDDADSLIRQTTADELDALMADGTLAGGMIPKIASCIQAVRNGVAAPTSSTAASPTCCCSRSSPTPASAPWSPARSLAPVATAAAEGARSDRPRLRRTADLCPFMPVFGPPQIMFIGRGTSCGTRGKLPRLPGGLAVIARHANPA
jgi:hypothetical protein